MSSPNVQMQLAVVDSRVDEEYLDALVSSLRATLLDADVTDVQRVHRGQAPAGTKAGEVVAIGTLLVTLAQSAEALRMVVDTVRTWLAGHPSRSVKLQVDGHVIELTGASSTDQRRLIDLFIEHITAARR